jgi:2-polyprenyl-3-methyl-5-hydroxy-6-metoxy-1,4-benzoquinol methylase
MGFVWQAGYLHFDSRWLNITSRPLTASPANRRLEVKDEAAGIALIQDSIESVRISEIGNLRVFCQDFTPMTPMPGKVGRPAGVRCISHEAENGERVATHGAQLAGGAAWGVWQLPESQLRVLGEVSGRDVLELGCGAAQWSIALHGLGARVTALDNSERQFAHARLLMAAAAVDFPTGAR